MCDLGWQSHNLVKYFRGEVEEKCIIACSCRSHRLNFRQACVDWEKGKTNLKQIMS